MKTFIAIGFVLCIFLAVADSKVGDKCSSQDDCDEDECCMQIIAMIPAKCRQMKKKGDLCVQEFDGLKHDDKDIYKYACPCAGEMECKPQDEKDNWGFELDKCE